MKYQYNNVSSLKCLYGTHTIQESKIKNINNIIPHNYQAMCSIKIYGDEYENNNNINYCKLQVGIMVKALQSD